jgi:hypothetical protein
VRGWLTSGYRFTDDWSPGRVVVWQRIGQRADGAFEVGQVFVHGGLQDRVRGIEVAMGEVVAHAGDHPPRGRCWRGQQVVRQCFNGLADLQQADADRVEDQPVGQIATLQVERIASIAAWISASR